MPPRRSRRNIFVANLPWFITNDDLYMVFKQFGPIKSVAVFPAKGRSPLGFGFVRFYHSAAARAALVHGADEMEMHCESRIPSGRDAFVHYGVHVSFARCKDDAPFSCDSDDDPDLSPQVAAAVSS